MIRALNLPTGNFFASKGSERRELEQLVAEWRPDVMLCQFGHYALRLLPIAEKYNVPLVAHFHGLDISSSIQQDRWYRWSLKKSISRFSEVICVGSEQRRRLLELGVSSSRIHLIPCGVPTNEFRFSNRKTGAVIRFISVGRLVEWKGVHHTIKSFAKASKEMMNAELMIVGDGPESDALKKLSHDLGVGESVTFAGSIPVLEVRDLLQESDVFVQHSVDHSNGWFEGFGVSIAEAAAMGLPVLVSACGGILDQVVDEVTGMVVPQRDEDSMAEGMMRLAADSDLRERMGAAGRKRMIEYFDTTNQIKKLEEVLLRGARR
jgi:glycosyltransferase involved in cell wall biosynthesis